MWFVDLRAIYLLQTIRAMKTKNVMIPVNNATDMQAFIASPRGSGPFPAVIVFQEAFGVNAHIRDVAERFAGEGYLAIAPELFHRTAPAGFEAPYGDFSLVMPHFQALDTEKLADDARATYDWLLNNEAVQKDRIGSVGFCLGGRAAFIANAVVPLAASVSFYGGGTHTIAGMASQLHGPQLFFWGGRDQHIKPEHIQTVIDEVQKAEKPFVNVVISYADHAFFCDARPSYHPEAAKEAWAMTIAFLKNKLS
jgi:carboxymethylenebutenolidase